MMLAKELIKAGNEYRVLCRQVPLGVIRSKAEYDRAVAALDAIIDEIGEDETHPLADLAEALGVFIEVYDKTHYPMAVPSAREMLRFLMEQNGLTLNQKGQCRLIFCVLLNSQFFSINRH